MTRQACAPLQLLAFCLGCCPICNAQPATAPEWIRGNTFYISTADNQWVLWLPMDSRKSIDTAFDTLAADYGAKRIWWRGGQDEVLLKHAQFRKGNRFYFAMWEWLRQCIDERKTNQAAIEAARRHKMPIYNISGIYEFYTKAESGGCIQYPYQCEDNLRVEHPEWIPANKFGTRRQDGPLELAYPECRTAIAKRLAADTVELGYDGLCLYTYNENFSLRYDDEFCFSEPVVREFKKRHGIDVRTQPFDRDAMAKLRGEHLTALLKELKQELAKHDRKLVVWLGAENGDLPQIWHSGGKVRTAGHIKMLWRDWIRENAVDELCIYWPGDEKLLKECVDAAKGSSVLISTFRTRGELPAGVNRVLSGGEEIESGFPREAQIGWPEEQTAKPPIDALKGDNSRAKRQLLYLAAKRQAEVPIEQIITATKDADLYVRRAALRAIAALQDKRGQQAAEEALKDPENAVQCQAAVALGKLGDPHAIGLILDAVNNGSTFQFNYVAAIDALAALGPKDIQRLVEHTKHPNPEVRRVALRALQGIPQGAFAEARTLMLEVAQHDTDPWIRELALGSLARYRFDPEVIHVMTAALKDPDETVQNRAAVYLTWLVSTSKATPFNPNAGESANARLDQPDPFELAAANSEEGKLQSVAFSQLLSFFQQYGDGCRRSDADWGWRSTGNSIACFGGAGRAALQKIIDEDKDQRLAELAWQVLYIRQDVMKFCLATEEEDEQSHRKRPAHMLKAVEPSNAPR